MGPNRYSFFSSTTFLRRGAAAATIRGGTVPPPPPLAYWEISIHNNNNIRVPFNVVTPIFSFNITARALMISSPPPAPLLLVIHTRCVHACVYVYTVYMYNHLGRRRAEDGGGVCTFCFYFYFLLAAPPNKKPRELEASGGGGVEGCSEYPRNDEDIKKPSDREARTENPFLSGWLHKHNINCVRNCGGGGGGIITCLVCLYLDSTRSGEHESRRALYVQYFYTIIKYCNMYKLQCAPWMEEFTEYCDRAPVEGSVYGSVTPNFPCRMLRIVCLRVFGASLCADRRILSFSQNATGI